MAYSITIEELAKRPILKENVTSFEFINKMTFEEYGLFLKEIDESFMKENISFTDDDLHANQISTIIDRDILYGLYLNYFC